MTKNISLKDWNGAGSTTVTVYAIKIEEARNKQLSPLLVPTTIQEWSSYVSDGKSSENYIMIDLLRIQRRFTITGKIYRTDIDNFREIIARGGSFNMTYAGDDYWVNMEKYTLTESPEDATGTTGHGEEAVPDYWDTTFTVIEGTSYGESHKP